MTVVKAENDVGHASMLMIRFLKSVDHWLGTALAHLLPRPSALSGSVEPTRSILLIRPGGIGDAVHLVPAIHALQLKYPGIAIDILAERRNVGTFVLCPGIRRTYHYDRPEELLRVLRNRYDVVIDTEQWHRLSAVVARMITSSIKVGYATNERSRLFTHTIPYSHEDYEAVSFLHLLEPLGIFAAAIPKRTWLQVPQAAREVVSLDLTDAGARPFIAFFPGGSIADRRWGVENFRTVAQWCGKRGIRVVVVGGKGEQGKAVCIADGLHHVLDLAGRTNLAETAAVLEQADVVVSGDSGILHIAVGLGRPTVSLFGPGIVAKWAPRGPQHVVLNKHLPCSPCTCFGTTPPCPHDNRCMSEITVDEVTMAIDAVIRACALKR